MLTSPQGLAKARWVNKHQSCYNCLIDWTCPPSLISSSLCERPDLYIVVTPVFYNTNLLS
jgi:hypothetical protein